MIYHKHHLLREEITRLQTKKQSVGFVPTMGGLHEGHLSLVLKALEGNKIVIVSIFVNPTQFDKAQDFEKYPRTLKADATLLKSLNGNILIYAPNTEDLYGNQVVSKKYNFKGLEHQMEGKFRDGHFDGVGTVLNLLFRAIRPNKAYFGEKDFQQLQVVKKLVEIEQLPINIIGCPILRESHGLAMSSRNKRLSPKLFEEAVIIHGTLLKIQKKFDSLSIHKLSKMATQSFEGNDYLKLEYFEIASVETLKTAKRKRKGNTYRAFIAAFAGDIRLIDNIALN